MDLFTSWKTIQIYVHSVYTHVCNKTRDILSDFSSILTNKHVHSMA